MGSARGVVGRAIAAMMLAVPVPASMAATCRPVQSVLPAAENPSERVVSVYWDISGTMSTSEAVTKEIVATLDSSILQLAQAREIRNYTIGNDIRSAEKAADVEPRPAQDTALHKVAAAIGRDLSDQKIGAAIIVSDLDLDIPDADLKQKNACPGVPMPTTSHAGAIFGRCFMSGLTAGATRVLPDLFLHAFSLQPQLSSTRSAKKKASPPRRFFVLLIARDVALGRSIAALMRRRWTQLAPGEFSIADSRAATDGLLSRVTCSWTDADLYEVVHSTNAGGREQCYFLCQETNGRAHLSFVVPKTGTGGLLQLSPRTVTANRAQASLGSDGRVVMALQCPSRLRKRYEPATATIHYNWSVVSNEQLPGDGNVKDLFTSLLSFLPQIVQPRSVTIAVQHR